MYAWVAIRHTSGLQSDILKSYNKRMTEFVFYPRYSQRRLIETLEDSPVVLIHGPR